MSGLCTCVQGVGCFGNCDEPKISLDERQAEVQRMELALREKQARLRRKAELKLSEAVYEVEKDLIRNKAIERRVDDAILLSDVKAAARTKPGSSGRAPTDPFETGNFTIAKPSKQKVELAEIGEELTDEELDQDRLIAEFEELDAAGQDRVRQLFFRGVPELDAIAQVSRGGE
jgi:hypothetical protein